MNEQWADWNRWLAERAGDVARGDIRNVVEAMWVGPPGGRHADGAGSAWLGGADQSEMMRSMLEVWFTMAETLLSNTWGFARQAGQTAADAARGESQDALSFSARPGQIAAGRLWLKNHSSDHLQRVDLRSTRPETAAGSSLDASVVRCRPDTVTDLLPGASLQIDIEVDVPAAAEPGSYHALILVEQLAATCRPIRIDVRAD